MASDSKQSSEKPWQFEKGKSGNPGGLTAQEREARDAMRLALSDPAMRARGLAAYGRLLDADNPVIAKDFMDRVAGKVKEHVELSGDPNNPVNPYAALNIEELKAIARAQLEKEKAK